MKFQRERAGTVTINFLKACIGKKAEDHRWTEVGRDNSGVIRCEGGKDHKKRKKTGGKYEKKNIERKYETIYV